ncbi:MAG: M24 family metallopeptidase, partial [Deltaproteobacteria bacterium]|nr:M24 family metallopeptidase [Deltaproteobacteria bacterium]
MILKTLEEILKMREAGLILWDVHQAAAQALCEGVTTKEVDKVVEERISRLGALPLFKGVPGRVPFPACTCISVNEEVVHGIPNERVIASGDIVSIDIGVKYNGFCADSAVTIPVGDVSETKMALLKVTEESLCMAISMLAPGISWNKIAKVMQKMIESAGYSIGRELVGHGIGREMWE